ncbi:unnamed protein product [Oncorhynchus mykiss]|uniref:Receptor ligand binding region domain-containing protein n=1 Tax=Oncorhynchus mykiss TaxID=8022 RepID=A0A060X9X3_ONCMY|nr:unnamed protein product [Oncorhynchus mykiss]
MTIIHFTRVRDIIQQPSRMRMEGVKLLLVLLLLLGACLQWVQSGMSSRHRDSHRRPREHREHRQHGNITLAIILPQRNTAYPWAWPRVGPALDRAINTINADPALLRGHHLGYVFENSENEEGICSESIAPLMAVDLKFAHDPWAFIGPGCDYTSSPVGLFTTHWDIPMVTAGAPAVGFNGINMYPSITNTGPTHKKLGKFGLHICKHFEWKEQVLLMFSDNKKDDRPCYFAVEGLYTELHLNNITSVDLVFEENTGPVNYSDLLHNIKQDGRVVFVCCSPDTFRQLMVHFQRAGLPQEEYVFFYIDMFGRSLDSQNAQPWARGDQDDLVAKEAFQWPWSLRQLVFPTVGLAWVELIMSCVNLKPCHPSHSGAQGWSVECTVKRRQADKWAEGDRNREKEALLCLCPLVHHVN